uniref:SEFIR domain-containing protein n=1 Tax=uncultured Thiotrichaceae bacterium TaxID=298394 RepID=A0A6S6S6J0_9GAMM|nr:MAG: Unknown protein [uncultured Thiotrichaceae bacterium]
MPTPRIFISYSHDSDTHRAFVLSLSNRLRADGLDCQVDQYVNGFPAEGWQRWMEERVEAADFVLMVCTPVYLKRFRGRDREGGRGVTFEGVVISQTLYDHFYENTKFVPVLPEGGVIEDVPLPLKGFGAFRMMAEYERLYRFLTGQPEVVVPEVGVVVDLPSPSPQPLSPKSGEGLSSASGTPRFTEPAGEPDVVPVARGMSDTMKAAWMGGVFALLAAVIAGLFALFAAPNITVSGSDCASVNTGEVSGTVKQNCEGKGDNEKK